MNERLDKDNDVICPNSNCEYDNHIKGANFCILCGTLLYQRCEDCLSANPKFAKYCYYCGTSLLELRSLYDQYEDSEETEN